MASAKSRQLIGRWRITHMELCDRDYLDLDGPAHITFEKDRLGSFEFGAVQGSIDYRLEMRDERPWVEFSWEGFDDSDPSCGRGWAAVNGGRLEGRFFFHQGDESSFIAEKTRAASGKHRAPSKQGASTSVRVMTVERVPARVTVAAIVEGIECQSDESASFLNRATGEVVTISHDQFAAAESGDEPEYLSDSETEANDFASIVEGSDDYLPLPSRFDIDEYRMMERFARGLESDEARATLLDALRGRGAFRRFKDKSHALGIIQEWYSYRDAALEEIAINWCEEHDVKFTRTTDGSTR